EFSPAAAKESGGGPPPGTSGPRAGMPVPLRARRGPAVWSPTGRLYPSLTAMLRRPLLLGTCVAACLAALVLLTAPAVRGQRQPSFDSNYVIGDERAIKSHVD